MEDPFRQRRSYLETFEGAISDMVIEHRRYTVRTGYALTTSTITGGEEEGKGLE